MKGGSRGFRGGRVKGRVERVPEEGLKESGEGGSKVFRDWVWRVGGMDQTALPFLFPHLRTSSMPGRLPSSALKTLQMDLMVRWESLRLCRRYRSRETSFIRNICSTFSFWLPQKQRIKSQIKL